MSTTIADAETYAARVRAALADLPEADREDLLADLADHLAEVEADGRLDELGDPETYAAELRASAGLPGPAADRAAVRRGPDVERWLAATRDFLPELLPGWWVVRALLLTTLLTTLSDGGVVLWLLLAVVLVPASVLLGRRFQARGRTGLALLLDAAAAVLLLGVLGMGSTMSTSSGSGPVEQVGPEQPAGLDGVTNLYPYDSQGRPLTGVLLYDQDGNPVRLQADLDPEGNLISRVPRYTTGGRVVGNLYPQEQTVTVYPTGGQAADGPTVRQVPPPTVSPPALRPR